MEGGETGQDAIYERRLKKGVGLKCWGEGELKSLEDRV